jgi:hypothetical protein
MVPSSSFILHPSSFILLRRASLAPARLCWYNARIPDRIRAFRRFFFGRS